MKKFISVLLTLIMVIILATPSFAANEKTEINYDGNPVIVVKGIDFGGLTYEDGTDAMQFTLENILKAIGGYFVDRLSGNSDALVENVVELLQKAFGPIACDKNGNSIEKVDMKKYPLSIDNYLSDGSWSENELGLVHSLADVVGGKNAYLFTYDWRKTPHELALDLNAFIDEVKRQTGKDKVELAACSMGGMVTTAYLSEFMNEKEVNSATYLSAAHNGTSVAGAALSGEVVIDSDYLYMYIDSLMKYANPVLKFTVKAFDYLGLFDGISYLANGFILKYKDRVYDELLRDYLGCSAGMWSMCPDEYFDRAVSYIFSGKEEEYKGVLEKIKGVREYVFSTEEILKNAKESGINLSFISHYNSSSMPLYDKANWQSDMVIESANTSNGGTFATYGETLSEEYLKTADSKYISPDKVVDASTAIYKESTWFIKDARHVGCFYGSDHAEFAAWVITSKKQPTVTDNPMYPQFMATDKDMNFIK